MQSSLNLQRDWIVLEVFCSVFCLSFSIWRRLSQISHMFFFYFLNLWSMSMCPMRISNFRAKLERKKMDEKRETWKSMLIKAPDWIDSLRSNLLTNWAEHRSSHASSRRLKKKSIFEVKKRAVKIPKLIKHLANLNELMCCFVVAFFFLFFFLGFNPKSMKNKENILANAYYRLRLFTKIMNSIQFNGNCSRFRKQKMKIT